MDYEIVFKLFAKYLLGNNFWGINLEIEKYKEE